MATLKELRLEAGLSVNGLAKLAKVDRQTVDRAENGLQYLM
jgi:predicted transcriptional regulator